jgi:hypothetical protein
MKYKLTHDGTHSEEKAATTNRDVVVDHSGVV